MPWWLTLLVTVVIILVSAFFVVVEFSLLAARRHRLEEEAESSRAARSALRSMNELTVMLAAAQLGITGATFALGAVTEPAVHHGLTPLLAAVGLPSIVADATAFVLALLAVTFLHLVIGEMMPKSWAIANPETAAKAVALPANGVVTALRPVLEWMNRAANRLVRRAGVEPVDRAAAGGYDAATLQQLLSHSTETGTLDAHVASGLTSVIRMGETTLGEVVADDQPVTAVDAGATVADVQRAARDSGHFRILLLPGAGTGALGLVHVRDTLLAAPDAPARSVARDALLIEAGCTMQDALVRLRREHHQLAVVVPDDGSGTLLGVVTAADLLDQLWPSIERDLDSASGGAR